MNSLSVTSGEFKGRKLVTPVGSKTHPMGSREKLAMMNSLISILGTLEACQGVLDAYCGSGALGIETLSRGAEKVVFVDNSRAALDATRKNLVALGLAQRSEIIKTDVKFYHPEEYFSLILLDPPYDDFHKEDFSHLEDNLAPSGVLALSHPGSINPAEIFNNLVLISTKTYAAAHISFYKHK